MYTSLNKAKKAASGYNQRTYEQGTFNSHDVKPQLSLNKINVSKISSSVHKKLYVIYRQPTAAAYISILVDD